MNIVLCGVKHCGKTTLAKFLAKDRGSLFVDTDELIENNYFLTSGEALSCRQIFQQSGQDFFWKLEAEALHQLADSSDEYDTERIISLGGGVASNPMVKVELLNKLGLLIYLKIDLKTAWKRIADKPELPAYLQESDDPKERFMSIAQKRSEIYAKDAKLTVEQNPEASPEENLAVLKNKLKELV